MVISRKKRIYVLFYDTQIILAIIVIVKNEKKKNSFITMCEKKKNNRIQIQKKNILQFINIIHI